MHAYRSLRKISSITAELHPFFFINYAFDVTCVDLAKLGIPQCITPWQMTAAAMLKSLNIQVRKSKEPLQKFTILKIDQIIKRIRSRESLGGSITGFVCINT